MSDARVDLDAILAEVRERVRRKRESGVYGPEVEALLRTELPGGRRLLSDDYLSTQPAHQGLLLHSVYHRPNNWDHIPPGR